MARLTRASEPATPGGPPPDWRPRIVDQASLAAHLERLPLEPGVYLMRDRKGRVLYVGKASKLRQRVRQYFSGADPRHFVPALAKSVGDIEVFVVANEREALLLENTLIKRHRPRFNFKLRDDKQYLLLTIDPREAWPRLRLVREPRDDGAHYFGPYESASQARAALKVVHRHFPLRTCSDRVLANRSRPCLQYQIGRCPAPCVLEVDRAKYGEQVDRLVLFLAGRRDDLLRELGDRMKAAAAALEFERAAALRDQAGALERLFARQRVVIDESIDQDVVGLFREGGQVELVIVQVRRGTVLGSTAWSERGMELPDHALLASVLFEYYERIGLVPDEILVPCELVDDDVRPLRALLAERRGRAVEIRWPRRGPRRALVELANTNAATAFATRRSRADDRQAALARVAARLRLSRPPVRMECIDVSHVQGSDVVASLVVFVDAEPARALYRSFRVRGTTTRPPPVAEPRGGPTRHNDDFASVYEVVHRRVARGLAGDDERWALPDLLVIDGGKGQLSSALAALADLGVPLGVDGIDVVALAKERHDAPTERRPRERLRPERVFLPDVKDPIALPVGSSELFLLTRLRDEAHRAAITRHRARRSKRLTTSALATIPGVGPALEKALLRRFGSVRGVARAELAELAAIPRVGPQLAARIRDTLAAPQTSPPAEPD